MPAVASSAANEPAVALVESIGGNVRAIAVGGTLAYVGKGSVLVILDMSVPAAPTRLGRLLLPDLVEDVQVADGLAYVANARRGLQIVDVAHPASPVLRGTFAGLASAQAVHVAGDRAYLADGSGGLRILRILEHRASLPLVWR